jgi:hypothetical protein
MEKSDIPPDPCHLGVPSGASKIIAKPMLRLTRILHRHEHCLQMERSDIPHDPCHLGVPSDASKMIAEAMVRLAQTMHLSCIDTNTVSKWKEVKFHMTHVTLELYQVHPKWLPSLWYVWHKLCTYLAPTLTLSPNEKRWHSTWPMSPRSSIRCNQNDCWAYGTFGTNYAPILHRTNTISN